MDTEIKPPQNTQKDARKRILFVITQSGIGGAQQFLAELISLPDNAFVFSIVAGCDGADAIKELIPRNTEYIVAKHLRRNPNFLSDIRSVFELKRIITAQRPDVLFLMSSKAGFSGSLAARLLLRKMPSLHIIYRIGGWSFNDPIAKWKKLIYRILEKISARWKDYIVVNNNYDLEIAQKLNIKPRKKLLLIHNGIDPYINLFEKQEARIKLFDKVYRHPASENIKGQTQLFQTDVIIGTVANFYETKGLDVLLSAIQHISEKAIYIIIGDGHLRPVIEKEIEDKGLVRKVFLAGSIPNARQFIPAFDILIMPSKKEGFPWIILEAIVAKVPIIATSVGAIPEILEHEKSGLIVPPGNPKILAESISHLLSNDTLRKELPIQAHQTLLKNFTLRKMIEEYKKLF